MILALNPKIMDLQAICFEHLGGPGTGIGAHEGWRRTNYDIIYDLRPDAGGILFFLRESYAWRVTWLP